MKRHHLFSEFLHGNLQLILYLLDVSQLVSLPLQLQNKLIRTFTDVHSLVLVFQHSLQILDFVVQLFVLLCQLCFIVMQCVDLRLSHCRNESSTNICELHSV